MAKICIDAGHYGKYNRSPANRSYYESEMNWKLAHLLDAELTRYGIEVWHTRKDLNKDMALEDRGKASSGADLMKMATVKVLKEKLLPMATLTTPNIPEAEVLSGMTIRTEADMIAAASAIYAECGCAVLLKGGHSISDANDLLFDGSDVQWFRGKRIHNPNNHGTGCTLSSAIASNLAKGRDLGASIQGAKDYLSGALAAMLDLGKGSGPLHHAYLLHSKNLIG